MRKNSFITFGLVLICVFIVLANSRIPILSPCNCSSYSYIELKRNGDTLYPIFQNRINNNNDTIENWVYRRNLSEDPIFKMAVSKYLLKSERVFSILGKHKLEILNINKPQIGDTIYLPEITVSSYRDENGLQSLNIYILVLDSVVETNYGLQYRFHGVYDLFSVDITKPLLTQYRLPYQGTAEHSKARGYLLFHPVLGITSRNFFESDTSKGYYSYANRKYVVNNDCYKKFKNYFDKK